MKNTTSEMKNTLDGINGRINSEEENLINSTAEETSQNEAQKGKKKMHQ